MSSRSSGSFGWLYTPRTGLLCSALKTCEDIPDLAGGLPPTTKQDKDYHGFGLKSILLAAENYGGSMTVSAEDNWFVLRVLIPMRE